MRTLVSAAADRDLMCVPILIHNLNFRSKPTIDGFVHLMPHVVQLSRLS